MKRFNCNKAGCEICWKAKVVWCVFGIKRYKCSEHEKSHGKIKAKNCLGFRCGKPDRKKECRNCRKGAKRK